MKLQSLLTGWLACVCAAGCTIDAPKGHSEQHVQPVLKKYGVESTVLRPKSALRELPPPGNKGFPFVLDGNPGVHIVLDRDYWVLGCASKTGTFDMYVLNPKDEQSALVISVDADSHEDSDAELTKEPGFTEITREPGIIAGEKIVWRRWSDAYHIYSDCSVQLPVVDAQNSKRHLVRLFVVANTAGRRQELEHNLDSIRLFLRSGTGGQMAEPIDAGNAGLRPRP